MKEKTMKNIKREKYLKKIEPFIGKVMIKVLVGQRRVGKSYLLLQIKELLISKNPNSINIFIDKEKYEFDNIKNYKDLIGFVESKKENNKVNNLFIDEIQEIEEFEKALRHFQSNDNFDIYCTGSNANLLSGELSTFLSGRHIEIKINSLSWKEFLLFHQLPNNNESLNKYITFGGLPFLINLEQNENVVYEYLKNIYNTIIYKDIVSRFNIRNTIFLENLIKYTADNVGNIFSAKKISDYLKSQKLNISPQIVLTYMEYLRQSFLIQIIKRADIYGKKIFEVGEKCYFEDWGIKNAIIGFKRQHINQLIENIVFHHLTISEFEIYVGKTGNKEIDFICERSGMKVYIQTAYVIPDDFVREREFGNLLSIQDNWRKIVVSLDEYLIKNYEGIEHLHLLDFLNNFE